MVSQIRKVFLVLGEKRQKAEDILKKDDVVGRQTIIIRMCSSLGFKDDGFFIIVEGPDSVIKKAKELLGDLVVEFKDEDAVLKKYDELEEKATHGLGFIMGE